jgi:putative oxidoreductase
LCARRSVALSTVIESTRSLSLENFLKGAEQSMRPFLLRLSGLYQRIFEGVDFVVQPIFLLAVRLYWGWQLIESGWGKLHNLSKVTEFFASLNLPMPAQMAVFISSVEFFGGIFLAVGLLSRLTALVLTVNMIMAYITADREALHSIFSDPDKFYAAAPYTFLIASLIILIFGPGKIAVDTILKPFFTPAETKELRLTG